MSELAILPVEGLPEFRPGDDLAGAIAGAAPWLRDGDVLAVTSKVVSKVEGRLVPAPGGTEERERVRQRAIDEETRRVVAARGGLRIAETRHGFVMAAAGVDASNVRTDEIALLPIDADASARALRARLRQLLGVSVAVVVTDTTGRPWRLGLVDMAVGAAGIGALADVRGETDQHGNTLQITEIAVADEIAAAADLVKGKLGGVPVAVVRGLHPVDDRRGVRALIRDSDGDLFRLGTAEAIALGRRDAGGAPAGPLHAAITETVRTYPGDLPSGQDAVRQAFLTLLDARPDAAWRSCVPGHITTGVMVVDPSRAAVLLTLHPRIGQWVEVGGHCEPGDATLADAARREAVEESGITGLRLDPLPLWLDIHPIVCSLGVPTRHFNACYLAIAGGADPVRSDESLDLAWFPYDRLPANVVPDLPHLVSLARDRLATRPRRGHGGREPRGAADHPVSSPPT